MPFPEEMTFCLKSAKESKELEQEAEPSYAFRVLGSLGHAGGPALWRRRGWALIGGDAAFSVSMPTASLKVSQDSLEPWTKPLNCSGHSLSCFPPAQGVVF